MSTVASIPAAAAGNASLHARATSVSPAAAWLSASTHERASTTSTAVARKSRIAAASGATAGFAASGGGQPLFGRGVGFGLGTGLGGVGFGGAVGLCGELIDGWRTWNVTCGLVITGLPLESTMLARRK